MVRPYLKPPRVGTGWDGPFFYPAEGGEGGGFWLVKTGLLSPGMEEKVTLEAFRIWTVIQIKHEKRAVY